MTSEYDEVRNILIKHGALGKDLDTLVDYGSELYDDLFGYYVNSGEMPYGVMKARTGTPDEWIADRLYELDLVKEDEPETVLDARDHHLINQNFKKVVGN